MSHNNPLFPSSEINFPYQAPPAVPQDAPSSCYNWCLNFYPTDSSCFNRCMTQVTNTGVEPYRPYNPFYSDSLSSNPNRIMWIIILIFIVGLIFYASQRK